MEQKDINNIKDFEVMLKQAVKLNDEVFIWDISGTDVVRVPVTLREVDGFSQRIKFTLDHRAKYYIDDLIKGVGMLKFYIPSKQLLFISKIDVYSGKDLEVYYPEAFKNHDRRKDDRLEPLIPVYFHIDKIKKECFDISKGGFSFIINNLEFKKLRYDKTTDLNCEIEFPFKRLKIKAKVVTVVEIKPYQLERFPYGAKKVACKIENNDFYDEMFEKFLKNMKKILFDLL